MKILIALVALGGLAFALHRAAQAPDGPQPIAWDHEACAHCAMLVGEPAYAAQLVDEDGHVLDFDDPGCLLAYRADHQVRVHAEWFHDVHADRWIAGDRVGFVPMAHSPMGYRLGAVEAGTPGALTPEAAARQIAGGAP
jgi:copper chaperone NosL